VADASELCEGREAMTGLTKGNRYSWFKTVWDALHAYREDLIPEGDELCDEIWDDICTAMSWIEEETK